MSAIHSLKELESYRPPPIEETLWWKQIEFYRAMRKHVDEGHIEVVIGGERVRIDVQVHIGGESPFCVATDLCGCNVFEWIYEAPDLMHRLLDLITTRMIETELMMRDICGAKKTGRIVLSDDSAQVVSIDDYREFVVPYTGRIYDTFAPGKNDRVMHLCGRHIHLYPALINDLRVEGMWGAGSRNTPEELRDVAGGRVWIVGNLDPMLLCDGPAELIAAETRRLLSALLPCGGLIVGDGYNVIPETPIRHLQVVEETVRAFCI
jgi:uroporphyrinogen-III decarboxylase